MVIQNNIPGLNSKRLNNKNSSKLAKSLEKLSSGYSINRAADDAAGLAVSEKMRSQIFGMKQSVKNCQDGISLIQTFEGALGETVTIIKRMKSLAVQASNGTYDDNVDRTAIQVEYSQLCDEVNHIADTDFNGIIMLNGGEMADKFTFLTESGVKWLTPSKAEFYEGSFISTFKETEGFPEIKMSIELLPEVKEKLVGDKELMYAFEKLNKASVKAFYDKGIPKYTLEDVDTRTMGKLSIETIGSTAVISAYTQQSGKVDIAVVECTELPHYASTSASGLWRDNRTIATGSYSAPLTTSPDGTKTFDLTKWTENYVNQTNDKGVTEDERKAYLDWIKATPNASAVIIADDTFDKDTDPLKFIWSIDGQEYENTGADGAYGAPTAGVSGLPVYPADYDGGPQVLIDNLIFKYNDEDLKAGAKFYLGTYSYSASCNGDRNSFAYASSTSARYTDIWLKNGNVNVTLTWDKANNKWSDNFGGEGSDKDYGINYSPYSKTSSLYNRNLEHYKEADGTLPDGFKLTFTTHCPRSRTTYSSGFYWNNDTVHNDKSYYWSDSTIVDFRMDEYDPAHPELGGVDYTVAEHGATYTYDGLTQGDGTVGTWRDKDGNAVNLEDKGVYLPANPDTREVLSLHDGMTITVSNPTMVGEDYIQAKIKLFDDDMSINAYRRIYDNVTYTDNLILQANARSKDSVNFTFAYSTNGIGGLAADLNCTAKGLGINTLTLKTQESANYAIDKLDHALNKVSMIRATFGAAQNRLEHKIDNLNNTTKNLTAAESLIRDTDMAKEMMNFTKNQILMQSSQSMLAQANSLPQQVMSLISG